MEGLNQSNFMPHLMHLSPAEYSAELFHKIFGGNVACDVIKSMASDFSEYSGTPEQGPGPENYKYCIRNVIFNYLSACDAFFAAA